MKPIKPKKMPKTLERWIGMTARSLESNSTLTINRARARSILAALEYERQRWQESQEKLAERNIGLLALARKYGWPDVDKEIEAARYGNHIADHLHVVLNPPLLLADPATDDHNVHLQVRGFHVEPRPAGEFTTQMGHNVTETAAGYSVTPDFQREQTEAVVPKPRKSPEIEASYARERNIARRKKLTAP